MKLLLVDNFDSFTYILRHYLLLFSDSVAVVRNDQSILLDKKYIKNFDALVFSPGPGIPSRAGYMPQLIDEYMAQKPMLGICLGHQALGEAMGGKVVHAVHPHHGVETKIRQTFHRMFNGFEENFTVGRYHSLVLKPQANAAEYLETAHSMEGEVMAIAHHKKLIWGMQFHPESCMTNNGLRLIQNWVEAVATTL